MTRVIKILIFQMTSSVIQTDQDIWEHVSLVPCVFNQALNQEHVLPLGKYSRIFQAEIYAILACVNSLHTEYDASIAICSNSQAALKALDTATTTSKLVAETMVELKRLSFFSSVRLILGSWTL